MADQIFVRAKEKMEGALEVAKREFATLRTGRANPGTS